MLGLILFQVRFKVGILRRVSGIESLIAGCEGLDVSSGFKKAAEIIWQGIVQCSGCYEWNFI